MPRPVVRYRTPTDGRDRFELTGRIAARAISSHWQAVVAITSLVAYGIVNLAYETFYRRLGTTPHDVGVDRTTVLTEAGEFLVLFLLVLSAAVLALVAAVRGPRPWAQTIGGLSGTAALSVLFFTYSPRVFVLLMIGLASVLAVLWLLSDIAEDHGPAAGWRGFFIACLVLLNLAIACWASISRGIGLADQVRAGNSPRDLNTFLQVAGDPVCLSRMASSTTEFERLVARPVALLGRDGSHDVVFNYAEQNVLLIPAAELTIRRVPTGHAVCSNP
jgi:hypothetical protein